MGEKLSIKSVNIIRIGCLVLVAGFIGLGTGCKEKVPYPKIPLGGEEPKIQPTPIGGGSQQALQDANTQEDEGPRPWLLVVTPQGSFLVTSSPGMDDLVVRRTKALVHVADDGQVFGFEPVMRDIGANGQMAFLRPVGRVSSDVPVTSFDISDIKQAFEADPDMAKTYYHRESLTAIGARKSVVTWLAKVQSFLGGAHPYASFELKSFDLLTGQLAKSTELEGDRNIPAEILGNRYKDACVRDLIGIAPVEGWQGKPAWLAALGHEFESCAGELLLAQLKDIPDETPDYLMDNLSQGTVSLGDESFPGVVDLRVARNKEMAVLLMGRDLKDKAPLPWQSSDPVAKNRMKRELRVWQKGTKQPVVIGRASALLSAQFLDGHEFPDRILKSFDAL